MREAELLRPLLLEEIDIASEPEDQKILELIDRLILEEEVTRKLPVSRKTEVRRELFYSVRRLDVLQELLDDPEVTEIMVNGYDSIFVEKQGKIFPFRKQFTSREKLEDIIQQIAGRCNRVVNEQNPIVDARLENGDRVNVVLCPIALNGPILTIRRFPEHPITMAQMVRQDCISKDAADFLKDLVCARYSILVGGGTSTGKTTFLNALSGFIPADERIITIEDNAELQIQGIQNLVRLEARSMHLEGRQDITIRELIRTSLRMRPSRIIIGEVRGAEAWDFLQALNTGHSGSLGTAHANSSTDMLGRLESMALMGIEIPLEAIRRQIVSGIEILVHLERDPDGRRHVEEIAEVDGMEEGTIRLNPLFQWDHRKGLSVCGELKNRKKLERFRS